LGYHLVAVLTLHVSKHANLRREDYMRSM